MADEADRAQDHIEKELENAIAAARMTTAAGGESAELCEECGCEIPEERRAAVPGVQFCTGCATIIEQSGMQYAARRRRRWAPLR